MPRANDQIFLCESTSKGCRLFRGTLDASMTCSVAADSAQRAQCIRAEGRGSAPTACERSVNKARVRVRCAQVLSIRLDNWSDAQLAHMRRLGNEA
eukprot:6188477-Pleurochrysis_carterae.AAC.1